MSYYLSTVLDLGMEASLEAVQSALEVEGFGIVTRIDMAETLRSKIGADIGPYVILGACNPKLAYEALQLEDKVGTMLPCNVIVRSREDGRTEVAAIDPVASMQAIDNRELKKAASEVRERLQRVVDSLSNPSEPDSSSLWPDDLAVAGVTCAA